MHQNLHIVQSYAPMSIHINWCTFLRDLTQFVSLYTSFCVPSIYSGIEWLSLRSPSHSMKSLFSHKHPCCVPLSSSLTECPHLPTAQEAILFQLMWTGPSWTAGQNGSEAHKKVTDFPWLILDGNEANNRRKLKINCIWKLKWIIKPTSQKWNWEIWMKIKYRKSGWIGTLTKNNLLISIFSKLKNHMNSFVHKLFTWFLSLEKLRSEELFWWVFLFTPPILFAPIYGI